MMKRMMRLIINRKCIYNWFPNINPTEFDFYIEYLKKKLQGFKTLTNQVIKTNEGVVRIMHKKSQLLIIRNPWFPIVCAFIGYMILFLFQKFAMNYEFMRSDVLSYWQDSNHWQTPFNTFHVPGYPLFIALIRGLTFNIFTPLMYMISINIISLLLCVFFIYKIILSLDKNPTHATIGALLFTFWPLVGLTYTISPLADIPSMCFFLAGLYLLVSSKKLPAGLVLGLAMIIHKAIWPFVAFIVLIYLLQKKPVITKSNFLFILLLAFPLVVLWVSGSVYHQSPTWIFSSNLDVEISSKRIFPILDGIIGTVMEGGIKNLSKTLLLLLFLLIAIYSFVLSVKNHSLTMTRILSIGISIAVITLFATLNHGEIWAAVRFSRLLIFPIVIYGIPRLEKKIPMVTQLIPCVILFFVLFLSQFVYAWYEARVFFA